MKKSKIKYWSICLFFQFLSHWLNAQELEINFFHLKRDNGLSDNTVNAIVNDNNGFLWVGTNVGLNRFDGNNFKTFYKTDDSTSLPNNLIRKLFLSRSGDLWTATNLNGISLFNTTTQNFTTYTFAKDRTNTDANIVVDITEDSDSIMFVGTKNGLFYKNPKDANFNELPVIDNQNPSINGILQDKSIAALAVDEQGIWIIHENWLVTYYHHKKNIVKHYNLKNSISQINFATILSALVINGELWIGTNQYTLVCFDPNKNKITEPLKKERIVSFYQLKLGKNKNTLWMATSDGLMRYFLSTRKLVRYTNGFMDAGSLSATAVSYIYEANENMIWVGTYSEGINYAYLNLPFKHLNISLNTNYSLSENGITSILLDSHKNMWFGYVSGNLERYNSKTNEKTKINVNSVLFPWGAGTIFNIYQDSNEKIYVCSWSGGVQVFDEAKSQFVPITGSTDSFLQLFDATDFRDIEEDSEGNFWFASHGKGIYYYNPVAKTVKKINQEIGLSNDWTFDIDIDTNGFIWVATAWGLSKIDPETYNIQAYFHDDNDTLSISDNLVHCIKVTNDGKILIGTNNGLNLYNENSDDFYNLKINNRQEEANISSIETDNEGSFWVSTTNGIVKFRLEELQNNLTYLDGYHLFTTEDGLQSNYFNIGSSSIDSYGLLYFGSSKGIDYFNPQSINAINTEPNLQIIDYKINGETVYPGSEKGPFIDEDGYILLTHKQNMLDFEYVAIHFNNVERDEYNYRLDPLNVNWINAGNNKKINFSNLKPGKFELSLRVKTDKGLTSTKENIVKFYIKPPFWQKTWFLVISFLIFVLLIILVIRIYTAFLRHKKNQLEKIVQERTSELNNKNEILKEQSNFLNETNTLLEERQQHIEEQSEELKAQSEKLAITNEELNKLVALKDKLFSIIAHDLKNPFNTILGFSELLKNSYKDFSEEKIKLMMEYINSAARSAYSLLENLLSWSRSQTNKLDVSPKYLRVSDIVESNYKLIQAAMSQKKLTFEANYDNALKVWADDALLNTVLRNLISNATKFTREGGKITVNVNDINENNICFEVKDTGIGLTKKEIEALFNIDTNISKPGTSGEKGTGIGMILCKEFVEKLNGKIWIESEPDKGTSVFFIVPSEPPK